MRAIDDVSLILFVKGGLCAKLAAEVFGGVGRGPGKGAGNIGHVGDDGFYTVTFALDFSREERHTKGT